MMVAEPCANINGLQVYWARNAALAGTDASFRKDRPAAEHEYKLVVTRTNMRKRKPETLRNFEISSLCFTLWPSLKSSGEH